MLVLDDKVASSIDVQRVLKTIGYEADSTVSARILSLVNEYAENSHNIVDPSSSYVIRDIEWVHAPIIFIKDSIIFKSQVIAKLLEQCQQVAIFTVTIGKHLEEMVAELAKDGRILQATVLDVIGSNAAEQLAAYVEEGISEEANSQGLCISRRFSPGYCDWEIDQQRMVFGAMKNDLANIRLTGDYLMIPQKSISGIVGLGPCDIENYNPCMTCKEQDCPGRR